MDGEEKQLLADLLDREKIREVLHRYCFAVDRGTVTEVMDLFADPCDLEVIPGKRHQGRDAVWQWYDRLVRKRMEVLRHLVHNQVIEIRGKEAFSKSYWDAVGDFRGESIVVAGFYEDRLRKEGGEWKFTEKIIQIDFMVPLHEGWGGETKIKQAVLHDVTAGSRGWR